MEYYDGSLFIPQALQTTKNFVKFFQSHFSSKQVILSNTGL